MQTLLSVLATHKASKQASKQVSLSVADHMSV